jgi:ribonuclease Z
MIRTLAALVAIFGALVGIGHAQPVPAANGADFRVTLLGTGSPAPVMNRFGPGTLIQAGSEVLVFDAGRGVTQRLLQSKLATQSPYQDPRPVERAAVRRLLEDAYAGHRPPAA